MIDLTQFRLPINIVIIFRVDCSKFYGLFRENRSTTKQRFDVAIN